MAGYETYDATLYPDPFWDVPGPESYQGDVTTTTAGEE